MNKQTKMEWVFTLMFAVAFGSSLTLLILLYGILNNALLGYGYIFYVNANALGEFLWEFIGMHIMLVILIVGVLWGWKYIMTRGK